LLLVLLSRAQATDGLNDALLRASAERASQAILMTPLITHDCDNEDQRLAAKVMIGTCWWGVARANIPQTLYTCVVDLFVS
jgi:hypothetical protein